MSRQLRKFEKRRTGIQQPIDAIPREEFPARRVAIASPRVSAQNDAIHVSLELVDDRFHPAKVVVVIRVLLRLDGSADGHRPGHGVE